MKKNKILFVTDRLPSSNGAGAENVLCALSDGLISLGIEHCFVISNDGVFFRDCVIKVGHIRVSDIISDGKLTEIAKKEFILFVFGDKAIRNMKLSAIVGKKIAWPDDPPYLPHFYKSFNKLVGKKSRLISLLLGLKLYFYHSLTLMSLKKYDLVLHHSSRHAAEFQKKGIYCKYVIPPVSNLKIFDSEIKKSKRLIHIGHLGGAASLMSLQELVCYPDIIKRIDFFGKKDIPLDLVNFLENTGARLMGFADNLEQEICSHFALIVSGNYPVGTRTRVLHAALYGYPIIINESALAGVPELEDYDNIYVYNNDYDSLNMIIQKLEAGDQKSLELSSHNNHLRNEECLQKWLSLILD